jgi:hypothetical protein
MEGSAGALAGQAVTSNQKEAISDRRPAIRNQRANDTELKPPVVFPAVERSAIDDFFLIAAGQQSEITQIELDKEKVWQLPTETNLVVYVGHDGLMDFRLESIYASKDAGKREAIILACASKAYFSSGLRATGAQPLLWTTGLMAPEAYTRKAALDGWAGESGEQIR